MMQRALLVHNDGAGDGKIGAKAMKQILEAAGMPVRHCSPKDPELARYLAGDEDLVIIAGGDGTVARIMSQIPDRAGCRVALVPLGTANNIAQSLRILSSVDPGAGEEILNAWQHANVHHVDIGVATGPWGEVNFVEALGIGPLARTIIQFKTEDVGPVDSMRLGRDALRHAIGLCRPLTSRVSLDGRQVGDDLLMVEVMNIQHAGSRVCLAPDADPGDGLFDVVMLRTGQRDDFAHWLEKGPDQDPPPVTVARARKVAIDWDGEPLRIDDYSPKAAKQSGQVTIGFARHRLAVLVPSARDKARDKEGAAPTAEAATNTAMPAAMPCP
jgi:diacylglycerol kinase (ATP)